MSNKSASRQYSISYMNSNEIVSMFIVAAHSNNKQRLPRLLLQLLGQAGRTLFSIYVIKPDETGVTGAIVSSCSS